VQDAPDQEDQECRMLLSGSGAILVGLPARIPSGIPDQEPSGCPTTD